jgi:drug/metabolite transporter (DMT)-like permease
MPAHIIAILVLGSICASSGTVLLKFGATGRTAILSFVNPQIIIGLALYGLGAVFWIYGLSRQSLISVYPFTILSFVIVYLVGILRLGEFPSRSGVIGVALILVGLYLVTRDTV